MKRRFIPILAILALALLVGVFLAKNPSRNSASTAHPAPSAAETAPPGAPPPLASPKIATTQASSTSPAAPQSPALPPLVQTTLGRPGAHPSPNTPPPIPNAPVPIDIPPDFLDRIVSGGTASFSLPGGGQATGSVDLVEHDEHGISTVQGRLDAPQPGFYFFHRESEPGVAGAFFGNVRFDDGLVAYRMEPTGPGGSPQLVPRRIDEVLCVGMPAPPEDSGDAAAAAQPAGDNASSAENSETPQNAPQTHPTDIPIPQSQNGIIPLQSLPGASAVIFLDFEGGDGPWTGWSPTYFTVAPANLTTAQIKEVWQRVSEDYQPFNINITTDRSVFEAAPRNSRQRVMVTPTNTASPGNGGVAFGGSFNSTSDTVCWAFYTSGKNGAEVIAHEVGHTVGLAHDGRQVPGETKSEYYLGHGSGDTGWAPIMGAGYYQVLSQWSKGEYDYATNTQDDLAIISNNNNNVDYRTDDYGSTLATAGYLEILADNTVSNEGIIERNTDVDAFRFQSTGGSVSLKVSRVNYGPDLDIEASIYNSSDVLVTAVNPASDLNATVSTTLPAGEYTLRVKGVGKDNATTGYTNYATLGSYLITGTVNGGVKPDRFSIPENSANGTSVGTVAPRNSHGSNPLVYSISSGNANSAFTINTTTGALTVANSSALNFETLSTRWDVPAAIPLFVSITDAANPSLNETIRVVVTVTDVNEAPTITGGAQTIFSRTQIGTKLMSVTASDPDHFDFPTYSIVAGNSAGLFAIDPGTGQLSVAGNINVSSTTAYPLTIRATDQLSPTKTADATVTITVRPLASQYTPGSIMLSYYENISGNGLSNLTSNAKFPDNPDSLESRTEIDTLNHGDNYGEVFRGYLLVPTTGDYTFRLSADDSAILYISVDSTQNLTTNNPRATVSSASGYHVYTGSGTITNLAAGSVRYIEVRHKEGTGDDYVSVTWEGPGISQQIISAAYLAPYAKNFTPKISATTLSVRENAVAGATVGTATATDLNNGDVLSYAITGGTGSSRFAIDSATGRISLTNTSGLAAGSSYTLQVQATDNGSPALSASATFTVNVTSATAINISGIARQIWNNFTGNLDQFNTLAGYPYSPDDTQILTSFDTGAGTKLNYASRIRAYIVPPTTGAYQFYIASDNSANLLMSTNDTPANATRIAYVSGVTDPYNYTTYTSQTSAVKNLVAGQSYYVEVLHRQAGGDEHLEVAWTGPGISTPTIIPGSALQPYNINVAPGFTNTPYNFSVSVAATNGTSVGTVNAADPENEAVIYSIVNGNSSGAFTINPSSGQITVANSSALATGTANLVIGAQDSGIGSIYPLGNSTATATISILTKLESWRQSTFGTDAGNSSIAGNSADPDGDGIPNIAEYAFGLAALTPDNLPVQTSLEKIGNSEYLRISASKDPNATDVSVVVEATGNLSNASAWTTSGTTVEENTSSSLRVRDNTPIGSASARFLRIRVTTP